MRRDSREVVSELVAQLRKQVDAESVAVAGEDKDVPDGESPNLDRLTVGVDLGNQWSNCCILGLGGETLTEDHFTCFYTAMNNYGRAVLVDAVDVGAKLFPGSFYGSGCRRRH